MPLMLLPEQGGPDLASHTKGTTCRITLQIPLAVVFLQSPHCMRSDGSQSNGRVGKVPEQGVPRVNHTLRFAI